MTINKNILSMSDSEYQLWLTTRRTIQPSATKVGAKGIKSRRKTLTQLAKELGIDKSKVIEALND